MLFLEEEFRCDPWSGKAGAARAEKKKIAAKETRDGNVSVSKDSRLKGKGLA